MEDEEGYTTLNLQSRTPVSPRGHLGNNKGLPAPSPMWRPIALILLTLCLVLFIGLVALLVMLFQASTASGDGTESLTLDKEDLQAAINNMSKRLEEIRESLCLKGEKNKNNGSSCILCPANWKWIGGDTCFYISEVQMSWKDSQNFCSSQNSTLLMLKDKDKLNYVPPRKDGVYYWIGLHKSNGNSWNWEDGSALSTQKTDWIHFNGWDTCSYLYGGRISNYYYDCKQKLFCICEKAAVKLKYIITERALAQSI